MADERFRPTGAVMATMDERSQWASIFDEEQGDPRHEKTYRVGCFVVRPLEQSFERFVLKSARW